ncbi:MAG TPA: APC family permease, partial [Firmicutes bacterium]|nr:APC family permease [Bacillota bacterium]
MKKSLRMFDLVLFTVCGILVVDTVAASAAVGVQSITWWLISMVLFFIPYGLVSAELGSAWPEEGGIYVWVRDAMGPFWGTMTSWLYWINVAYWMPSVFVLFAGILQSVFWPGLPMWGQALVAILLTWVTVWVGILDLNIGKWIPNVGALVKVGIMAFLGVIGIGYGLSHGTANSFAAGEWAPAWSNALAFAPVIVYNYMGFELMSSASGEMVNPRKDVPKAIFLGGLFIALAYIFSTFGILAALPVEKVNIVTGITDALQVMINDIMGPSFGWLFSVLGVLVLFTFLANMVTWSIGANRVIAATGLDKKVPSLLGHKHPKYHTPDYAYYIMGVVGTVLVIGNYVGSENVQNVFWTLFALSSIVFLLPYL